MRQTVFKAKGLLKRRPASAIKRHRHPCLFVARQIFTDRPDALALVTNYAARGLALQAVDPPETGAHLTIQIGDIGSYRGVVRWRTARAFGVRIDGTLDVLSLSLAKAGPQLSDYDLPHSPAFEGLYLHAAFRQGNFADA